MDNDTLDFVDSLYKIAKSQSTNNLAYGRITSYNLETNTYKIQLVDGGEVLATGSGLDTNAYIEGTTVTVLKQSNDSTYVNIVGSGPNIPLTGKTITL